MDEVNEKISLTQETCLATYNGFYCLNEILNAILYCCEHLNKKLYSPSTASTHKNMRRTSLNSTTDSTTRQEDTNDVDTLKELKSLQLDYKVNVTDKLDSLRKIVNQIQPLNYRLEILENIYSLVYLSSNDLKDSDESDDKFEDDDGDYSDDDDEAENVKGRVHPAGKLLANNKSETTLATNRSSNLSESFEILSTSMDETKVNSHTNASSAVNANDAEFSIYASERVEEAKREQQTLAPPLLLLQKRHSPSISSSSSRRFYREYSSNGGVDDEMRASGGGNLTSFYRNNAGGGGTFLVNDFMCRDLLLMVKDLVHAGFSSHQKANANKNVNYFLGF